LEPDPGDGSGRDLVAILDSTTRKQYSLQAHMQRFTEEVMCLCGQAEDWRLRKGKVDKRRISNYEPGRGLVWTNNSVP
jgi:hypothetical protein